MSGETVITRVPRPARCHTQIGEIGHRLELCSPRFFRGQGCAAAFLGLWLAGWSAGCSMLLAQIRAEPSLLHILFAIPFITAWFAASGLLIGIVFGRHWLTIDPQGLDYQFHAILPWRRRHVPLEELKRAISATTLAQSDSDRTQTCLRIETTGQPVDFGGNFSPEELRWLVQRVNARDADCGLRIKGSYRPSSNAFAGTGLFAQSWGGASRHGLAIRFGCAAWL